MNYSDSYSQNSERIAQLGEQVKNATLFQQAKSQAIIAKMRQQYTIVLNHRCKTGNYIGVSDDAAYLRFIEEDFKPIQDSAEQKNLLITVNPPEGYPLTQLTKLIAEVRKKKNFLEIMTYSYEVRAYNPKSKEYTGLHCHIFTESRGPPKTDIIKRIHQSSKQLAKNVVGLPTIPSTSIDVKSVSENAENYVKGIKNDTEKQAKMKISLDYRTLHNLEDFYVEEPL